MPVIQYNKLPGGGYIAHYTGILNSRITDDQNRLGKGLSQELVKQSKREIVIAGRIKSRKMYKNIVRRNVVNTRYNSEWRIEGKMFYTTFQNDGTARTGWGRGITAAKFFQKAARYVRTSQKWKGYLS